ncbi:GNAT family N-acetyltransferase [Paenibacillus mucilaginosus]|uniref:Acetyltransferase, GNAT family n=1 Tax=Paenibacillus mucilaginosus 3016 TaxID=1116391 RepID=H6NK88_9BACL|nr:GNAT family N-acetyltransferase [Paenibacillus mucilaginosus]AFC31572.1 acetyltransferase, GNAT family [Paenibacillus mucilaginosus 3016]MCG7212518.1 GNAT family N-acetyltransferase [Paenibacillus mucilaginosus]
MHNYSKKPQCQVRRRSSYPWILSSVPSFRGRRTTIGSINPLAGTRKRTGRRRGCTRPLRGSWYLVACYRNGQLAASGRLVSDGIHQCFVCDLIVLPDFRGQGIGGRILEQLLDHCRSRGIRWVQLACAKGKRGFYEKYGFTARAPDAPGMNLLKGRERTIGPILKTPDYLAPESSFRLNRSMRPDRMIVRPRAPMA